MPVSIDIDQQETSPFEQEPRLIGFYHWNRSIRTMHQHANCIELNFMISGNGTHIVGNEICHTQPGDIIIYDSKVMHDESLMLDSLTDACCIAVTGLGFTLLGESLREALDLTPADRLLVETDAPHSRDRPAMALRVL